MAFQAVNTTDSPNAGRTRWNANDIELYALARSQIFNVKEFGGLGTGFGTAAVDQQAHTDAFAAANAASYGGIVYTPPGDWYLTGAFTQGARVVWQGAGPGRTTIAHNDTTNTLVTSLADGNTGGEYPQRGWRGLRIWGATGSANKGIVFGNASFPFLENIVISGYTSGSAVEINNTVNFTENVRFDGVEIYNCLRCVDMVAPDAARKSFGGLFLRNFLFNPSLDNGLGLRVGANCYVYGGTLAGRFVGERASAVCLDVNGTAQLTMMQYALSFEGLPQSGQANGGTAVQLQSGAILNGNGQIDRLGSITHNINSAAALALHPLMTQSVDRGNNSVTLNAYDAPVQRFDTTLSGSNKTVTLPTANLQNGQRFRIIRTGVGAFTLTVQTATPTQIRQIPASTQGMVEVMWNGSTWLLVGYSQWT